MNRQQNQFHPPSPLKRRREILACRQCGHEKTYCDGLPCANCGEEGVVCENKDCNHPSGAIDRGYVEWLENERKILSLGVREACRRLIEANLWSRGSLPRVGRLLSMHDMLVGLELIQDSNETNPRGERSERKDSARVERESLLGTNHAPGKTALDPNSDRNTYTAGSLNHDLPHGEPLRPQTADPSLRSSQSPATALASLLDDTSLARRSGSDAAFTMPQHPQIVNLGQDGQLWVHTTDAYQEASGPSDLGTRTFPVQSGTGGVQRHSNTSRHDPEQPPATWEAITSEEDKMPSDGDEETSDYIKIPF